MKNRKLLWAIVVFVGGLLMATIAGAQTPTPNPGPLVDHWATSKECLEATSAPFYVPSILSQRKLATNEEVRGFPTGACAHMRLPDRLGGWGWVRTEPGRRFVFDSKTAKVLRLAECNNDTDEIVPFTAPPAFDFRSAIANAVKEMQPRDGHDGAKGDKGDPGKDGVTTVRVMETKGSHKTLWWVLGSVAAGTGTAIVLAAANRDGGGSSGVTVNVNVGTPELPSVGRTCPITGCS